MQEITDRRYGRQKKTNGGGTKLLPVRGRTKIIPRDGLSPLLYMQGDIVRMYQFYFARKLGTLNMTKDQEEIAEDVRRRFETCVTEVFDPNANGREMWPYTLSEEDLCKLAWAIHINQETILVPQWVKVEKVS